MLGPGKAWITTDNDKKQLVVRYKYPAIILSWTLQLTRLLISSITSSTSSTKSRRSSISSIIMRLTMTSGPGAAVDPWVWRRGQRREWLIPCSILAFLGAALASMRGTRSAHNHAHKRHARKAGETHHARPAEKNAFCSGQTRAKADRRTKSAGLLFSTARPPTRCAARL